MWHSWFWHLWRFYFDKVVYSIPEMSSDRNSIILYLPIRITPEPTKNITYNKWIKFTKSLMTLTHTSSRWTSLKIFISFVDKVTNEIKYVINRAITKKLANEFYKLISHVCNLTNDKNRARKIWQRVPEDNVINHRSQQDFTNYLYWKCQGCWDEFLKSLSPKGTFI